MRDIRSITANSVAEGRIDEAVEQLITQLDRLYSIGARAFMVANIANIGRMPETISRAGSDGLIVSRAEGYVRLYNQKLRIALSSFSSKEGVSVREFDLFQELEALAANIDSLGFTQTEVGCFTLSRFSFHPDCNLGTRFDRFVFFNSLHPSANNTLTWDIHSLIKLGRNREGA